ncbi:MAG TPA: DHH family phosphoesterase [Candidatus Bilamarchaeum sp.]|nr:DHH family phosphoesterase [Candidatus Bilamarchaeum sp.]
MRGVKYSHGRKEYTITDGKTDFSFPSEEPLSQGACVFLQGEITAGGMIRPTTLRSASGDEEKRIYAKVRERIRESLAIPAMPQLLDDESTRKFWPMLQRAAFEIMAAKRLGRFVLVHFHGDADGIVSAFAVSSLVRCKALQQNSAVYSVKDALRDLAANGQESRPLIVLLDFGSGSREGLDILRAAGVEYLVIDHHPVSGEDEAVANPLKADASFSKYTAGYLACEVACACGGAREEWLAWAKVACSGDKSEILESGAGDATKAMVLDFLASHVSFGNNLDFYKKVMGQEELFLSISRQADESIAEAAQKAAAKMKVSETGRLKIASFPLESIVRKGEWPPSSKITTRVFDSLKGEKPLLCIGYTDRTIIMRLNDGAAALGLSANGLAEKMKSSMGDFVEGGGGHVKAGAIRAKKGFVKDVLNELVRIAEG